jgi:hypothetical protein
VSFLVLPLADALPRDIDPYLSLMIAGFVIAIFGHMARARWLVLIGIVMIGLACLIFPLTKVATEETPPPPRQGIEGL